MTNTIISRAIAGAAVSGLAIALFLAIPQAANAGGYNYGGGYGGNYGSYVGDNYNRQYPPAPTFRTIPSVQVVYPNGYYTNYFVPTVRYFPPTNPVPVVTTYYQPYFPTPVPTYPRHW